MHCICEGPVPLFYCAFQPDGMPRSQPVRSGPAETVEFTAVRAALDSNPSARLVLMSPQPAELLSARLRAGEDPDLSLQRTAEDTGAVLSVYRRARRRILLLETYECAQSPDLLDRAVQAWGEGSAPQPAAAAGGEAHQEHALSLVIAKAVIAGDPQAGNLAAEFEASRTALTDPADFQSQLALDAARQWRALPERAAETIGVPAGAPVSDGAHDGDLAHQRIVIAELQGALEECQAELARLYQQPGAGQAAGGFSASDQELYRRLNSVELERDGLRADLNALEVEAGHLRRDNRQVREALEEIRRSNSWKITAPLRRFRGGSNVSGGGEPE